MPASPPTNTPTFEPPKPEPPKPDPANPEFDAFHPSMPQIPGVKSASSKAGALEPNRRLLIIGGIAAGAFLVLLSLVWLVESFRHRPVTSPAPEPAVVAAAPDNPAPSSPPIVHDGPIIAATVEELSKPWSAKKFTFVKPLTYETVDSMVIRLPGGSLWAFALQEPYGQCELEYVTDVGKVASQYGYRANHPMVVDPCAKTVYDPLKIGTIGNDILARGEIVKGGGLRPPIAVEVKVSGHSIIADSIE